MTTNEYLRKVLESQTLSDGSNEIKALQAHRADVEKLLRENFADCSPMIRYGGSKAKGTMIKASYDLDLICYFLHNDTAAGETLREIYDNAKSALESDYVVEPKTSALRIKDAEEATKGHDFHIDVVPGRFTDDTKTDAFLHQSGTDKERLKTNIDVHISHVRDSGLTDVIKLIKYWKVLNGIVLKNFVLELTAIEILKHNKGSTLSAQLEHFWTQLRDHIDDIAVEDPANPEGNDLSAVLDAAKEALRAVARRTLATTDSSEWETVFGSVEGSVDANKSARLRSIAAAVPTPTRPWAHDDQ